MSTRSKWLTMSFKFSVLLLIYIYIYKYSINYLKRIVDISEYKNISLCSSVNFCFEYFESLLLGE